MTLDVEAIIREYVDKTVHMSLASVRDNKPWVCEVHFAYDDELNLYFRSLPSRRHSQDIDSNSSVAGNIVKEYPLGQPCGGAIYFEGTARLLEAGNEQSVAAKCLKNRLKIDKDIVAETTDATGNQFYKITVESWCAFGKFGDQPAQKYTLEWKK